MQLGPYNAPLALGSRPMMALFWAVFAPSTFLIALSVLMDAVGGGWASAQFDTETGTFQGRWIIYALGYLIVFAAMSLWAEQIGAGPFGGPLRPAAPWVVIGVITGPAVLQSTTALTGLLAGGEGDWMYREGFDTSMISAAAMSPLMAAFVILLAPLVEEVGFRGIGIGCLLARGWPPVAAVALTAGLFTGLHLNLSPLGLIPVFIMGLYLGLLRIWSGGMAAPIMAHLGANGFAMLGLFFSVT